MHKDVRARVRYLPEYLHQAPLRVLRGCIAYLNNLQRSGLLKIFLQDLRRDPTRNRLRRLGQALVLARELPKDIRHIHAHYLHTPASVARYAALLTGRTWSVSAHAKDIWTTPEWEKREKLASAAWAVTCTREGASHLSALAPDASRVALAYHGLDLSRFPLPKDDKSARDGSNPADPVRIVSVGRAVEKKGFDDLLKALAALPSDCHWRFAHIGGGEQLATLKAQTQAMGIEEKTAFLGARSQPDVIALLQEADLFALPAKPASSGDQDGLPNAVMEAASQALAIVASDFAGIPEFLRHNVEGVLVPPGDWTALANALNILIRDPAQRAVLGAAAYNRLKDAFSMEAGITLVESRLRASVNMTPRQ